MGHQVGVGSHGAYLDGFANRFNVRKFGIRYKLSTIVTGGGTSRGRGMIP